MQQEQITLPTQNIDSLFDNLKQDETQMTLANDENVEVRLAA